MLAVVYVHVQGGRLRLDSLVHERLREPRLVDLVVAVAPVSDHIDDDVRVVPLAVLRRKLERARDSLGVVAVDMEYRGVERFP